ncbi:MAG: hypothetical protein JO128_02570, partial [Alphaproteobacteria bacterium]|nr:hypothetical protein [Alphaproteobacteria bacterium]
MPASSRVQHLISAAAPYWAGEAEVVRTYFASPKRTRDTDLAWLARQCFKEFWGSGTSKHDRGGVFLGVLKSLVTKTPEIDVTFDRHDVLDVIEGLKAE